MEYRGIKIQESVLKPINIDGYRWIDFDGVPHWLEDLDKAYSSIDRYLLSITFLSTTIIYN